jgi:hypothetical protein
MWQHISKSHRITTKVDAADKCSLAAFKAALDFIPIIVMPVVASLNLLYVVAAADDDLRCFMKCANFRSEFCAKKIWS